MGTARTDNAVPLTSASNVVAAGWVVAAITALCALIGDPFWHWFVVPTAAAGVLVGVDVVAWARSQLGTFSPRALVALFGFHAVYAVPMLHVFWDTWPLFVAPAADWRQALGVVGCINVAGLLLYRIVLARPVEQPEHEPAVELDRRAFKLAATAAVLAGLGMFVYTVQSYGGPTGYLGVLVDAERRGDALAGAGWRLLIAESWPLVWFVAFVVLRRDTLARKPVVLLAVVVAFAVVQFLVGGLRGSRANTVWPLLIGLGVVHLAVREIRRRSLVAAVTLLLSFSWLYGLYKAYGDDTLRTVTRVGIAQGADAAGRSGERVVLEDFGRAGIQAVLVDRAVAGRTPPVWGQTYAGAGLFLLPAGPLPIDPQGKVEAGTNMLYGANSYVEGSGSSRIYGLLGEGILNFGLWLAAVPFLALGFAVRYAEGLYRRGGLVAAVLAPVAGVSCILLLGSDLDNVVYFLVKHGAPIALVVFAGRRAVKRRSSTTRHPVVALR